MISIEGNTPNFKLTNDQFATVAGLVKLDVGQDYDIVEDQDGRIHLWVHWERAEAGLTPTRYWIEVDGNVSLAEDVDWDWEGVGEPTPEDAVVDELIAQGLVEEVDGMVTVEVEWFRTETFAGQVQMPEGYTLEDDEFGEQLEDAIHNLSAPEEAAAFDGCTEFEITKKRIITKEDTNG